MTRHQHDPYPAQARWRQALAGLTALVVLAALLGGIPWALVHYIGWPLPHTLPTWPGLRAGLTAHTIPVQVLLKTLALAVWAGWAVLAAAAATETVAATRGRPAIRFRPAGPLQPLAAGLVGAVALAVLAVLPRPAPAGHVPLADVLTLHPAHATISTAVNTADPQRSQAPSPATAATSPAPTAVLAGGAVTRPYVVARRDTLWGIAERQLGDPLRWSQIYALNRGQTMPDGRILNDPNKIWPGWILHLPADTARVVPPDMSAPATTAPTLRPTAPDPVPTPPAPGLAPAGTDRVRPPVTDPSTRPPANGAGPTSDPELQPSTRVPDDTRPASGPTSVVELPSGSVIGGSFAAGLAAALMLGRLRRRHGYRPRPPEPGRCMAPPQLGPTLRRLAAAARTPDTTDDDEQPRLQFASAVAADGPRPVTPPAPELPSDDPDRRERPDLIDVSTTDPTTEPTHAGRSEPVTVALTDLGGVALTGPGADDTARAWLAALLVRAGPLAAEILITTAGRDRLLPGLPHLPGLRVLGSPEVLLHKLEVEVLARTRQLDDPDTPAPGTSPPDDQPAQVDRAAADAVGYRRAHPYEPLPTLIAVLDTIPADDSGRWQATLEAGGRLGLGALILAPTDAAATRIDVRADHIAAIDEQRLLAVLPGCARLFGLTADETIEVLAALADSEHRPNSDDPIRSGNAPDGRPQNEDSDRAPNPTSVTGPPSADGGSPTQPWPDIPHPSIPAAPTDTSSAGPGPVDRPDQPNPDRSKPDRPITVQLLGSYVISVDGEPVRTGLRTIAKELLAWYLLRPDGATVDAAVDALWPDTDPALVHRKFWHAAANLRSRLRASDDSDHADRDEVKVLVQTGGVYRPQTEVIVCDLWDFQEALSHAVRAERKGDQTAARDALQAAVDSYRGDFVSQTGYLWAEPVRQDLHRRVLDAHLRLAELDQQLLRPEAAVLVLEKAVALDGVAEEPYRRLMAAQARLGRPDAVRATWRALQRRLTDLDVDPEPATLGLYRNLTRDAPASPGHDDNTAPFATR